ncbi:MAG: ribokinase [Rubrivivax sp.]|nr:ribokinase [Rubrivivax sp.]
MLVVAGSLNVDLVGRAPRIPAAGETVLGAALQRHHGGKGGNQAVAAVRLGAAVRFFGAVGRDAAGEELCAALVAEGIDAAGVVRVEQASGAALITVSNDGENAITVLPGANLAVAPPAAGALQGARALLLQQEITPAVNLAWARAARDARVPVLLNAAPADAAAAAAVLPWVDLLLVNQRELQQLGGREAALGPPVVVTTLGAAGCRCWQHGRAIALPGHAVDVVDTTGAGDTFAGALAAALVAGKGLAAAVREANLAAALSCRRAGARGGMPRRAELQQALAADGMED